MKRKSDVWAEKLSVKSSSMSRIGKTTIAIPSGVTVEIAGSQAIVKGPKGELSMSVVPGIVIEQQQTEDGANVIVVSVQNEELGAMWGTTRALLMNMVTGVTEGWSKSLELNGVGFRMDLKGSTLTFRLGFSHEIDYPLPEGIEATIENNILKIAGIDRQLVGQVAAEIRGFKKPEPYKGKGFRYTDEIVRRKAGKAAKSE